MANNYISLARRGNRLMRTVLKNNYTNIEVGNYDISYLII